MLNRTLRALFVLAFAWCALVEIAEFVADFLFGMVLDGDWFLLLTGSAASDRVAFFRANAWTLALAAASFALCVAGASWIACRASNRVFAAAVALAAVAVAVRVFSVGALRAWKPVYVAFDTVRSTRGYGRIGAAGRWTPERAAKARAPQGGATNYVFVIGESLTTSRIQFFGYGKTTMPRLAALGDRLSAQGPVRVNSPYTVTALAQLLISDGASAPVWFRLGGWNTCFVGAHDRWGRYCSVEAAIFAACEQKVYLSDINDGKPIFDEQLLPHAERMMRHEPFALFVHMIGSHFRPETRVPPGFATDEGLDGYDRSVRYTDDVLGKLIAMLPPRTQLFYISDHGESVDAGGWRDFRSESLWSVPVFVYPASAAPHISSIGDFVAAWRRAADSVPAAE